MQRQICLSCYIKRQICCVHFNTIPKHVKVMVWYTSSTRRVHTTMATPFNAHFRLYLIHWKYATVHSNTSRQAVHMYANPTYLKSFFQSISLFIYKNINWLQDKILYSSSIYHHHHHHQSIILIVLQDRIHDFYYTYQYYIFAIVIVWIIV